MSASYLGHSRGRGVRLALSLVYSRQEARTFKGAFPSPYVFLSGEKMLRKEILMGVLVTTKYVQTPDF